MVAPMLASKAAAVGLAASCAACSLTLGFDDLSAWSSPYASFRCSALKPAPRFCDDFDGPEVPFSRWSSFVVENGTASLDESTFVSPGRSFLSTSRAFQLGADDVSAAAYAQIDLEDIPNEAIRLTMTFEFMVESFDSSADSHVTLLSFDYDREDGGHLLDLDLVPVPGLYLALGEQKFITDESEPEIFLHDRLGGDAVVQGTWYHVEYVLEIREPNGAENYFAVNVDGEPRKTGQFMFPLAGGQPDIMLGISYLAGSGANPWRLRFDNFLVQVEML
jgi:hypothetical protein